MWASKTIQFLKYTKRIYRIMNSKNKTSTLYSIDIRYTHTSKILIISTWNCQIFVTISYGVKNTFLI